MAETSRSVATQKMWDAVEFAQETASAADLEFDRASRMIQSDASRNIDLFGGSAVTQVADIVVESRIACDKLYAALQAALRVLDQTCRPLLDFQPNPSAIKGVYDEIRTLNCDSKIQNNFTASFNSRNLGDVATNRYIPSLESRMIEQFWYSEYQKIAEEADREEEEIQAKEIALQQQKEEEEKRAREEFLEKHKKEIDEYDKKAEESMILLARLEEDAFEKKTADVESSRKKAMEEAKETVSKEFDEKISKVKEEKDKISQAYVQNANSLRAELEAEKRSLCELGTLQFLKTKSIEKKIEALMSQMQEKNEAFEGEKQKVESEIKKLEEGRRDTLEKQIEKIEEQYYLPEKVADPEETVEGKLYEALKDEICDLLQTFEDASSISDIKYICGTNEKFPNQSVSRAVCELVSENYISRKREGSTVYYYFSESNKKRRISKNAMPMIEDLTKEQTISYRQLGEADLQLEDYEKYGYLKWLAKYRRIYCDFQEDDFDIYYIPEEYRKCIDGEKVE